MRPNLYVQLSPGADLHLRGDRMIHVRGDAVSAVALDDPLRRRVLDVSFGDDPHPIELPVGLYVLHIQFRVAPGPNRFDQISWPIAVPATGTPIVLTMDQYDRMHTHLKHLGHVRTVDKVPSWQRMLSDLIETEWVRHVDTLDQIASATRGAFG